MFGRLLNPLAGFFQAPKPEQVALARELNREIGRLRHLCDERLRTIERLTSEAELLLKAIEASRDTGPTANGVPGNERT